MKMKKEHYDKIKKALSPLIASNKENYKREGLSKVRFAWDLFYACPLPLEVRQDIYQYLNDSHIQTALFRIIGDY